MTRLIDTNELMELVKNWQKMDHYYSGKKSNDIPISELEDIIERMPTVDAIPIEWIMKYYADHPFNFVSGMIYDWAMEQAERKED